MCHHVHVTLSADEKKEVRKLAGVMIPVYASILLAMIVVAVANGSRQDALIAASSAPTAMR